MSKERKASWRCEPPRCATTTVSPNTSPQDAAARSNADPKLLNLQTRSYTLLASTELPLGLQGQLPVHLAAVDLGNRRQGVPAQGAGHVHPQLGPGAGRGQVAQAV